MCARLVERKVAARRAHVDHVADMQSLVGAQRAAAAVRVALDRHHVAVALARWVHQRVLPHQLTEMQVDVRTGLERRQCRLGGVAELVDVDRLRGVFDAHQAQAQRRARCHSHTPKHKPVPVPAGVR